MSIDYVHGPLADTITRFSGNHSQVDNFKVRHNRINQYFGCLMYRTIAQAWSLIVHLEGDGGGSLLLSILLLLSLIILKVVVEDGQAIFVGGTWVEDEDDDGHSDDDDDDDGDEGGDVDNGDVDLKDHDDGHVDEIQSNYFCCLLVNIQ